MTTSHTSQPDKTRQLYLTIAVGCALFVVLTLIAMLTYTGGTVDDHAAPLAIPSPTTS